jgi:hypothetical protein
MNCSWVGAGGRMVSVGHERNVRRNYCGERSIRLGVVASAAFTAAFAGTTTANVARATADELRRPDPAPLLLLFGTADPHRSGPTTAASAAPGSTRNA